MQPLSKEFENEANQKGGREDRFSVVLNSNTEMPLCVTCHRVLRASHTKMSSFKMKCFAKYIYASICNLGFLFGGSLSSRYLQGPWT